VTDRDAFLAGDRPDDVLIYLSDAVVGNRAALESVGDPVSDGVVLVVPGTEGRQALERAVDVDPMAFAQAAMDTEGAIAPDCTDGTCPAAGEPDGHAVQFVFAFVEARNPEVGGLYAEGDVVHAYAQCACGERFADRWVAGSRD